MVWSWAVTSLRVLGRLCEGRISLYSFPKIESNSHILLFNPRLGSWGLLRLLVFAGGAVGGGGLPGLEVKETCHSGSRSVYLQQLKHR